MQEKIEQVMPLKKDMAQAQETAKNAKAKLDIALKEQYKIMEEVNMQRAMRDKALKDAKDYSDKLGRFELQLGNSDSLTLSLAEEQDRWSNNVNVIKEQITNLIGDVFIAASALSYYGPFTGTQRDLLVTDWIAKAGKLNIPRSEKFSLDRILSDPLEVRNWRVNGLPSDTVAVCNACLSTKSTRFPILIDPQELAYTWLTNLGSTFRPKEDDSNNFKSVKHEKKDKNKTIAKAIETGWIVLVYDCPEKLDNNIDMLLMQKSNNVGAEEGAEFKVQFEGKE